MTTLGKSKQNCNRHVCTCLYGSGRLQPENKNYTSPYSRSHQFGLISFAIFALSFLAPVLT